MEMPAELRTELDRLRLISTGFINRSIAEETIKKFEAKYQEGLKIGTTAKANK